MSIIPIVMNCFVVKANTIVIGFKKAISSNLEAMSVTRLRGAVPVLCECVEQRRPDLVCLARLASLVNNLARSMDRFANLRRGAARSFVNMALRGGLHS